MGLMDATEYDPRPAQRRNRLIVGLALAVVLAGIFWYFFRYWPEEHVINKFFEAIESNNMETAYGLYNGDPDCDIPTGGDEDALNSYMTEAQGSLTEDQWQMVGRRMQERFPDWAAAHGIT